MSRGPETEQHIVLPGEMLSIRELALRARDTLCSMANIPVEAIAMAMAMAIAIAMAMAMA